MYWGGRIQQRSSTATRQAQIAALAEPAMQLAPVHVMPEKDKITTPVVMPEPAKIVGQQPEQDTGAQAEQQALTVKSKKKEQAWAAFFKPYPSCQHPPTWEDQVDCGNRYIRARREFEKQWLVSESAQ